ncbi:MAG: phosphonoacetaldehyde reductase, partial [Caldicoprobacteraceae bacterium]
TEIVYTNRKNMQRLILSLNSVNLVLIMSESSSIRWNMTSFIEQLEEKCKSMDGTFIWIKNIKPNPTPKDIMQALHFIGDKKVDVIIALGGGSAIDLAKGISAFYNSKKNTEYTIEQITENIKLREYENRRLVDVIAIPSTAGTGSEVTQWATIWDESNHTKLSIDNPMLQPKMAIIVPELTLSMPAKITLSSGLDAISHAIESYWSKHTNPIVQEIAYRAIELIVQNLREAIEEPYNLIIREDLCKASLLAGLAFSQTRTTACHSISYPLTIFYNIPHGLASSITLDAVSRINRGNFPNDTVLFDLFDKYDGIMNWINMVSEGVVEMKLSSFGIKLQDIKFIAGNAFTSGRMDNNPVNLTKNDVEKILHSIL